MTIGKSPRAKSFCYVSDFGSEAIFNLLARAKEIKTQFREKGQLNRPLKKKQVALFFAEASTRTRLSFQMAAQRLGAQCLCIDGGASSSMSKGESFADTFWTIHGMAPDLIVVRGGADIELDDLIAKSQIPVVNAGYGPFAHPTQALLDVMTLLEHRVSMEDQKIVFVGDIKHSRVAASHFRLLSLLKAEVGVCAPGALLPESLPAGVKSFTQLDDAIEWATVYCGLRVQLERHRESQEFSQATFQQQFGLNRERLKSMAETALIIHSRTCELGSGVCS